MTDFWARISNRAIRRESGLAGMGMLCCRWAAVLVALTLATPGRTADAPTEVLSAMDATVSPCDDFYQHACGGWIAATPIPEDEIDVVRGFGTAEDRLRASLLVVLQQAAATPASEDARVAGSYFSACLSALDNDTGGAGQDALAPLRPYLDQIAAIGSTDDFLIVAGRLATIGVPAVFELSLMPDLMLQSGPRNYIYRLDPAEPGFEDGDVYRKRDRFNRQLRLDLGTIITTVLTRAGDAIDAARHAKDIVALESMLAKFHPYFGTPARVVLADRSAMFLASPRQDWSRYWAGAGLPSSGDILFDRTFVQSLGNALAKIPLDSLRSYLRWKLIRAYRQYLPRYYRTVTALSPALDALRPAAFAPSWRQCVDDTAANLSETVGRLWSESLAPAALLTQTSVMAERLRDRFVAGLPAVAWLDEYSRQNTLGKARNIDVQLGMPDRWLAESTIPVSRDAYLGNTIAVRRHKFAVAAERIGQPVDRQAWDRDMSQLSAMSINAAYTPLTNQAYIPLGIQLPPFFDTGFPLAMNYGGLGTIVGHELIHGFDNGSHFFDRNGALGEIWTQPVVSAFNSRSQCLVKQYGRYKIARPPMPVKGKPTLRENLADNGGVSLAFEAFRSVSSEPLEALSGIGTLTHAQLFFVAFAQNFCEKTTDAYLRYIQSRSWNRYPPNRFRVIGSLANSPDFAVAFGCPVGSPMNPRRECRVW